MQVKADVRVLQQIPLFEDSDAGHLQLLSFASKRVELEKGSILFQKGTTGAAAYLVLEGTAEVYDTTEASGDVVATAESGALLGELSMIANVAFSASRRGVS
jgi:CRP-like cAMP-binding protein